MPVVREPEPKPRRRRGLPSVSNDGPLSASVVGGAVDAPSGTKGGKAKGSYDGSPSTPLALNSHQPPDSVLHTQHSADRQETTDFADDDFSDPRTKGRRRGARTTADDREFREIQELLKPHGYRVEDVGDFEKLPLGLWCELFVKVQAKSGAIVPLVFNPAQKLVTSVWGGPRLIVLKPRQIGSTVLFLAIWYWMVVVRGGSNIALVLPEKSVTIRLLKRFQLMHDQMPRWYQPRMSRKSMMEKSFPGRSSALWIGTQGQRAFGRGDSLTAAHCSEVPFWPNDERQMTAIVAAVAQPAQGGVLVAEGTANGPGGWFYDRWLEAEEEISLWHRGRMFVPWYAAPDYRTARKPNDWRGLLPLWKGREEGLAKLGLGADRIEFRRVMCREYDAHDYGPGSRGEQKFLVEMPEDPASAFEGVSGTPVVPGNVLMMMDQFRAPGADYVVTGIPADFKVIQVGG